MVAHCSGMGDFRRLEVWRAAHQAACEVYRLSASWPLDERFGLTSQIRRASVSVVSNIAEGAGRMSDRELCRFVRIARGSNQEVLAQVLIAESLGFLAPDEVTTLRRRVERIGAMLSGMLKRLGRTA